MTDGSTDLTRSPRLRRTTFAQGWSRPFTWLAAAALGAILLAALAVAATAAALIGLLAAFGALVLRLAPGKRAEPGVAATLEGRRTADGWVVEAAAPR